MTLRQKLVIAFATVAVVVAVLVGAFTYALTAHNLHIEVDRSLATAASTLSAPGALPLVTAAAGAADQQVAPPTPALSRPLIRRRGGRHGSPREANSGHQPSATRITVGFMRSSC